MNLTLRPFLMIALAFVLVPGLCILFAQSPKELDDIGMHEADQCSGIKKVCKAASMDKKYKKDCDEFTVSLNNSSNRDLRTAYDNLEAAQPSIPLARRYANMVCDYDPALAAKKRELLAAIEKKTDDSPAKILDAERLLNSGDLDGASVAAKQVTDAGLQPRANAVLQKISGYNADIQEAKRKEAASDLGGAKSSYQAAQSISRNGPGDPSGNISRLDGLLSAKAKEEEKAKQPTLVAEQPKQPVVVATQSKPPMVGKPSNLPPPPPPDVNAEVAQLFAKEKQDEPLRLREALRDCQQVQRLQPGNVEAQACLARIQELINSDPKEQAKVLADALRAFYRLNYAEAEDDLTSYLSSTTAKYRGAAYFYLGASRLYREILDTAGQKAAEPAKSPQVQRPFKDARNACYRPIDKYLSPVVLSAWNASTGSATCAR